MNTKQVEFISKPVLRAMVPLLVIILLIIVVTAGYFILNQHKRILRTQIDQMSDRISDAFFAELENLAQGMRHALIPISMDPRVIESLETNNKGRLFSDWHGVLKEMSITKEVHHFTFLDKNRLRFLRVHNPEMSGGIVNRHTAIEAERTGETAWGLELEMGSLEIPTLRVIRPVFNTNGIVGYVELGSDLENILKQIHDRTDSHLLLVVNKQFLNRSKWEHTMKVLQRDHDWERFTHDVLTFTTKNDIPYEVVRRRSEMSMDEVLEGFRFSNNGKVIYVSAIELANSKGQAFGHLYYTIDITDPILSHRKTVYAGVTIGVLLTLLFITITVYFINKTDKVINSQQVHLKESEGKFKSLVKSSPDIILTVNTNKIITFINRTDLEAYRGQDCRALFHPSYELKVKRLLETAFEQNKPMQIEHIFNDKYFESRFVPLAIDDKVTSVIITTTNLTERKRSEILIKEQAEQFEEILNTSINGFFIVSTEGRFVEANKALVDMSGYNRAELLNLRIKDLEVIDSDEQIAKRIQEIIEIGGASFETNHKRKDGTIYNVKVNVAFNRSKSELIGFISDITQQKEAELLIKETNLRFKLAEKAANIGVWDWDLTNDRVFWSDELKILLGISSLGGYTDLEFFMRHIHKEDVTKVRNQIQDVIENNSPWKMEFRVVRNDERIIWLRSTGKLYFSDSKIPQRMTGVVVDITAQKIHDQILSNALKEKEILLKEVHHRVKNNLQIISSLLYLQSLQIGDEAIADMFQNSLNRVRSMALVHEHLYKSDNFNHIDFKHYVGELISVLKESFGNQMVPVNVKVDIQTNIRFDQVIYCGLIITELISNALKYAFKDRSAGVVEVSVKKKQGHFLLKVADNGVGVHDKTIDNGKSLGFNIIKELTRQLKGILKISSNNGTLVKIKFPETLT